MLEWIRRMVSPSRESRLYDAPDGTTYTKIQASRIVARALPSLGWVTRRVDDLFLIDFQAERSELEIFVHCSGSDLPLNGSSIGSVRAAAIERNRYAVFVHGDTEDSRWRDALYLDRDILLAVQDIGLLEERVRDIVAGRAARAG